MSWRIGRTFQALFSYLSSFLQSRNPNEKAIALVAIDILGILCTSTSGERFFTVPRYLRLQLAAEKVETVSIISGNPEIADIVKNLRNQE